jgi:nucleoside-diphosphate-sugar epimerase
VGGGVYRVGGAEGGEAEVGAWPAGATILVTGASGFVGKAVLSALLRETEGARVRVLLRSRDRDDARRRLVEEILGAEPFRDAPAGTVERMLGEREIEAISGDLGDEGLASAAKEQLRGIDTVIHCAASVSFEEPLDAALRINGYGPARLAAALRAAGSEPHFVHVSTAYTADCRVPIVNEADTHPGLARLDPAVVLAEAEGWRAEVDAEAAKAGRDERWIEQRLAARGRAFAATAGWPDTYSMTKAIGEMLLLRESPRTTIVRPSIVESALRSPSPGWIEGFKVADPLIIAYASRGLTHLPGRADNPIDLVPVDCVANACIAAAAHPPAAGTRLVSVSSSARNPITLGNLAGATHSYFSRHPLTNRAGKEIRFGELRFTSRGRALIWSRGREELLGLGARAAAIPPARRAQPALRRNQRLAGRIRRMVEIYAPYTTLSCRFDDSGAEALAAELDAEERARFPFDTGEIDWTEYLEGTHMPRLHEMVTEAFAARAARDRAT